MVRYFKGEVLFTTLYIMSTVVYYIRFTMKSLIYFISVIVISFEKI